MTKIFLLSKEETEKAIEDCSNIYLKLHPLSKKEAKKFLKRYDIFLTSALPKNYISSFGYISEQNLYLGE